MKEKWEDTMYKKLDREIEEKTNLARLPVRLRLILLKGEPIVVNKNMAEVYNIKDYMKKTIQ